MSTWFQTNHCYIIYIYIFILPYIFLYIHLLVQWHSWGTDEDRGQNCQIFALEHVSTLLANANRSQYFVTKTLKRSEKETIRVHEHLWNLPANILFHRGMSEKIAGFCQKRSTLLHEWPWKNPHTFRDSRHERKFGDGRKSVWYFSPIWGIQFCGTQKTIALWFGNGKKGFATTFCIRVGNYLDMQLAMFWIRFGWLILLCDFFIC